MAQPPPSPRRPPSSDELTDEPGEPMESTRHVQQMVLLIESLQDAWRERSDFHVAGNVPLYFSAAQVPRNDFRGPDVFVVLGTTRRERRAWVLWQEDGQSPEVVIELLSASTEHVDRGEKMQTYCMLRVGEYFLFDPFTGVLEGYIRDVSRSQYVLKAPDALGRLSCDQMGLLLGKIRGTVHAIEADWLRWMTPDGRVLPSPSERAAAEAERAAAAEERANLLAAELEALKAKLASAK